jgi:hypothetical protein
MGCFPLPEGVAEMQESPQYPKKGILQDARQTGSVGFNFLNRMFCKKAHRHTVTPSAVARDFSKLKQPGSCPNFSKTPLVSFHLSQCDATVPFSGGVAPTATMLSMEPSSGILDAFVPRSLSNWFEV